MQSFSGGFGRARYSIILALHLSLFALTRNRMTDTAQPASEAPAAAKTTLDINDIQRILPHRFPFLLIDRVLDLTRRERIVAIKNVTMNEPFFAGHFPNQPIM